MPVAESENEIAKLMQRQSFGFVGDDASAQELSPAPPSPPGPPKPPAKTNATIGIIYPPPEVRNIVDKTASFVARNGPDFETRIKSNEQGNNKFNFLNPGDPYHAYYQHKVVEIREGKTAPTPAAIAASEVKSKTLQLIDDAKKKKQAELLAKVELPFVPKDPPPEYEFMGEPPSISAHDLDLVKLTAQFVARNGRQFLSSLMNREQRNYQFDFLRPQHSLFQYFTRLLDQYTKVLIPPKDIVNKLKNEQRSKLLADAKYRANWIRHQEAQRRKVEEEVERERMAYSSIDWHDFVVVETVEYQAFEQGQFPPPTTPEEVGARVLLQDRLLQGQSTTKEDGSGAVHDDTEVQDMEEDSSSSSEDEDSETTTSSKPDPAAVQAQEQNRIMGASAEPPRGDQVIIRKGYDPKKLQPGGAGLDKRTDAARSGPRPEEFTISPITGERIPVSKLHEHMRIGLLDPRWRDQRDRQLMDRVNHESVYAPGGAIETSLKQLAERRSDIFGVGVEETPIGKKMGEEERIPGMPWDPNVGLSIGREEEGKSAEERKEPIGPTLEPAPAPSGAVTQMLKMSGTSGILQAPPVVTTTANTPQIPQHMPGIVRPANVNMNIPPGMPHGGMMMMQNMGRVGMGPLLGIPGQGHPHQFSQFSGPPPGRPPLLPNVPPPSMAPPPQMPPPPMHVVQPPPPLPEDEPAAKKAKTLEDSLIPEAQFLATNRSPATFIVSLPSMPEKPEMNLNGQAITITLPLNETVTTLKSRINDMIGLPLGKQKLRLIEGLFFKDGFSLAYYNVGEGATVHLSLKERGGRKK